MRFPRFAFLASFALVTQFASAQQTPAPTVQAPQRDPQAVAILTQVITTAGGTSAVAGISDFTATGNITCYWSQPTQGTVTVRGRGLHEFRVDATLADGLHSWVVNNSASFQKNPDGSRSQLPLQNTVKVVSTFPLLEVLLAIQDTSFNISYGGIVTHDGQQVHDILVQKIVSSGTDPIGEFSAITKAHIFIDPNALTVESIADSAYSRDGAGECTHETQFSAYQTVNGVLVPFSVTELVGGQQTTTIQLNQVTFNNGLTDTDFE